MLQKLVQNLNLKKNIELLGYKKDVIPYIMNADLFVNSSRYDGFPMVLIEALFCGTPIISTNCLSGPSEILDNGEYGKLIDVGDYKSMAKEIINSVSEKIDKAKLIARSKKYTIENISSKYLGYF